MYNISVSFRCMAVIQLYIDMYISIFFFSIDINTILKK